MPGVDDRRCSCTEVDPRHLPGHELASLGEVAQSGVCEAGLFGESGSGPACVTQRTDEHGGKDRGAHFVAHGVGHREVQRVAVDREVERVAADIAGGFEPGGERELPGLAGV
jgi:hypothetical protein